MPCVPATSSRRSMPPRNVQLTSNWPIAPDSNRMSAIALSSSSIGWTSVSVVHMTSTGRLPLPTKLRMISMQWQPRSMIAPPPVSRPSQNQAEWGPGCVSRDRTQVTSPIAPLSHRRDGLERLGRVAQVLEVPAEDPGPLDRLEHPARLVRGPAQRLRAQDGLARGGDRGDGLLVEEVRAARRPRRRSPGGGSPPAMSVVCSGIDQRSLNALRPRLAARVHDVHPVAAALPVQRHRVEVADEAGPEHRDRVVLHRSWLRFVVGVGGRFRRRARRASRRSAGRCALDTLS